MNSLLEILFFNPEIRYHFLRLDTKTLGGNYIDVLIKYNRRMV